MRIDQAPPGDGPPLARSVAACLAAILELPAGEVPVPAGYDPWTVWRGWLATRGLGLVTVGAPATFDWPGPWIALLDGADRGEPVAALAFDAVVAGYAVAPHDVALWAPGRAAAAPTTPGRVELVAVAAAPTAPMRVVERAPARAG